MAAVYMKDGLQKLLDGGESTIGNITVHLYKNNHTPAKGDVAADYTEADFSGYAATESGSFTGDTWDGTNHIWTAQSPAVTFTVGAGGTPNTVYGVYYTADSDGKLVAAELFAAPVTMNTVGFSITWTPVLTVESKNG